MVVALTQHRMIKQAELRGSKVDRMVGWVDGRLVGWLLFVGLMAGGLTGWWFDGLTGWLAFSLFEKSLPNLVGRSAGITLMALSVRRSELR
eukprot:229635-Chlamydomonas_euryale.AAC.2